MAIKFPNIPNFGEYNVSEISVPNSISQLGPPREIELKDNEERKVKNIRHAFLRSGLTVNSLFNFFNEWQSNKTKSVKRFVLSLSFVLSLTLVAGANITDIDLFGVSVDENMTTTFLGSLFFILVISFIYYEYLRKNDLKIHGAKINSIKSQLNNCLEMVESIDEIVEENKINSVEILFDDFREIHDRGNEDLEAYEAIKFYQKSLQKPQKSFDLMDKIEVLFIYGLGLFATLAIIFSLYKESL